jgi:hypothetical protein
MHTENHLQTAGGVDPDALDDRIAGMDHRALATEEPQPAAPHTRPHGEALSYPPLCAHGMSSFADRRYHLALTRVRSG